MNRLKPSCSDSCIEYILKYVWYYYVYKPINDKIQVPIK